MLSFLMGAKNLQISYNSGAKFPVSVGNLCCRIDRAVRRDMQVASDWPNGIFSTTPYSFISSRGEYLRVVGIIEMVELIARYL